jgi:hypothetical protein
MARFLDYFRTAELPAQSPEVDPHEVRLSPTASIEMLSDVLTENELDRCVAAADVQSAWARESLSLEDASPGACDGDSLASSMAPCTIECRTLSGAVHTVRLREGAHTSELRSALGVGPKAKLFRNGDLLRDDDLLSTLASDTFLTVHLVEESGSDDESSGADDADGAHGADGAAGGNNVVNSAVEGEGNEEHGEQMIGSATESSALASASRSFKRAFGLIVALIVLMTMGGLALRALRQDVAGAGRNGRGGDTPARPSSVKTWSTQLQPECEIRGEDTTMFSYFDKKRKLACPAYAHVPEKYTMVRNFVVKETAAGIGASHFRAADANVVAAEAVDLKSVDLKAVDPKAGDPRFADARRPLLALLSATSILAVTASRPDPNEVRWPL